MPTSKWSDIIERLRTEADVEFDAPLTDAEVDHVETLFSFRFPPDLREFLQTALPVSNGFPNWRDESEASLRERLSIPLEGIIFDVEHNDFWVPEWGAQPETLAAAIQFVTQTVSAAPTLIPIYKHRMLPDRPNLDGNPVFSVHQTDIICYGNDLRDYLMHDFLSGNPGTWPINENLREIEFWDINRFGEIRWGNDGIARFDNRKGTLP